MRRNQRANDPIAEHEELLVKAINSGKKEYLLLYAQYFAGAQDPQEVTMTDLDAMGFTLAYKELETADPDVEPKERELVQKEIRVQFDSPVLHLNSIEPKLFAMAKEAVRALDKSTVDGSYVPPGAKTTSAVPRSVVIIASILWSFLLYSSFIAPSNAMLKKTALLPEPVAKNILFVVTIIHAAELVAAVAICLWSQMPAGLSLKYGVMSFFGGLPAFKEAIKAAFMYRRDLEAKTT